MCYTVLAWLVKLQVRLDQERIVKKSKQESLEYEIQSYLIVANK
jgi:hypothetical protein